MLKNNFILFLRNIIRYKSTFLINTVGLASGLTCVLLIGLWVNDELQVDKFHANESNIYQVWSKYDNSNGVKVFSWTPPLLAETMVEQLPEVKYATSQTLPEWYENTPITVNGQVTKTEGIFADTDFFKIFSYDLLEGDKEQVLSGVNSVVISESLAMKLFGSTKNIVNSTIELDIMNSKEKKQISGIFTDTPSNSTTRFDFILPFKVWKNNMIRNGREISWLNNNPSTYILLKEDVNVEEFEKKIAGFVKAQNSEATANLIMTKYSSNYLYGIFENGIQTAGRMNYIYLFSVFALFILLIACINFMNLSTANASRRSKEIGIKKTLGSSRGSLIVQYFGESILTTLIALIFALLITAIFIPKFNELTNKSLSLGFELHSFLLVIGVVLLTGLMAGSYPAMYLSKSNIIASLKSHTNSSLREGLIRKGLVVFQFTLSTILILGVLLISNQIDFIQSKNLGFSKDNVVFFNKDGQLNKNSASFISEVKKIPNVLNIATTSSNMIGSFINETGGLIWTGDDNERKTRFNELRIGENFIETMGMRLQEGRSFSKDFAGENESIIFNETAIKMMGLKNSIGKTVTYGGQQYEIIGVLEDFHFKSFKEAISPMFFRLGKADSFSQFAVKIEAGKEKETLSKIEEVYASFNPGFVFDYNFLDTVFQRQYESEMRMSSLSKYFAILAIIISSLGLFGLAAFTVEQRKKEIGIRKVLGASVNSVLALVMNSFLKLVVIALLIATPIAYFLMKNWLENFAYKVEIKWWMFALASSIAIIITFLTVGFQSLKAAIANPTKSLRSE